VIIIPDKDTFMNEVNNIENDDIKNNLVIIYNHLMKYKKYEKIGGITKEVLKQLFENKFTPQVLIPLEFLDTAIGKVIFTAMFNYSDRTYTVRELIEFTKTPEKPKGLSKAQISQDFASGKLKGEKKGNRLIFTESQVNDYLISKGYDPLS